MVFVKSPGSGPLQRFPHPRRFPWFCRVPGFWASTAASTFHGASRGFAEPPDSGPLHRFPLSTVFPVGLQSPRILGLYNAFHFPRCFPWFCSVPGFWPSTTVSSFHGVSHGFAVSPGSGPLQKLPLSTAFPVGLQCPHFLGLYNGFHFSTASPMVF